MSDFEIANQNTPVVEDVPGSHPQPRFRLRAATKVPKLASLDGRQTEVLEAILAASGHAVITGRPGAGRTTVALALAKRAFDSGMRVSFLVPDRARADLLQPQAQPILPGIVRPVRTSVSYAYEIVAQDLVERQAKAAPQLLTGAQEDALLEDLLAAQAQNWPGECQPMLPLPSFRMAVRNLMARAREVGWSGARLSEIGTALKRPLWVEVGKLMGQWDQANRDGEITQLTVPQLEVMAAEVLQRLEPAALNDGEVGHLVVVDDLQDMTLATLKLLQASAIAGSRIVATANPDIAVAAYRGGEAQLHVLLAQSIGATEYCLGPTYRSNLALSRVVDSIVERIPPGTSWQRRTFGAYDPAEGTEHLQLQVFASSSQEGSAIAQYLTRLHSREGYALNDMAVIVRSNAAMKRIRTALLRAGIEASTSDRAVVYSTDALARQMLELLDLGTYSNGTISQCLHDLLLSPLYAVDTMALERLIDTVRRSVGMESEVISASWGLEQIADALRDIKDRVTNQEEPTGETREVELKLWGWIEAEGLLPLAQQLIAARALLANCQQQWHRRSPRQALWKIWDAAGVQTQWVEQALQGGVRGSIADDRLDVVISLMRSADVWEQRHPGQDASEFAAELLLEKVPTDTLAVAGVRPPGVRVLTAAQAAGQQWPVVVVSGVNRDEWPTNSIADSLMRSAEVTELGLKRLSEDDLADNRRMLQQATRVHRDTESRLFAAAISRAQERLFITAVRDEETDPSLFTEVVAAHMGVSVTEFGTVPTSEVPAGIDSRSIVARLKRDLLRFDTLDADRERAAKVLALLAAAGVHGANPEQWNALGDLTPALKQNDRAKPYLSPSAMQTLVECPARWLLTRHGGDNRAGEAAALGTIIHEIAEKHPHGDADTLEGELLERWSEIAPDNDATLDQRRLQQAIDKIRKLGDIFQGFGGRVDCEQPFKVDVGDAIIAGFIDRLEYLDDGSVRIADIKTGKSPTYQSRMGENLQLTLYQYALGHENAGAQRHQIAGARLIPLGEKNPDKYFQSSIWRAPEDSSGAPAETEASAGETVDEAANSGSDRNDPLKQIQLLVHQAAQTVTGVQFPATPSYLACRSCPVRSVCPAQSEGERTLE